MKKIVSLLLVFTLVLVGCFDSDTSDLGETGCLDYGPDETIIGLATDTGGINDKSFNQGTWEGVEQYCADYGVGAEYIEGTDDSTYTSNLNALASRNEVVIATGYLFEYAVGEAAVANPDTYFIMIDGVPRDANDEELELDNVHSYLFGEEEAGYLAGYIAGSVTETDKVGFVGGMEIPSVQKFGWGFIAGAQDANPNIEIEYTYVGSFDDPSLGKTSADAMYSTGVDIIFTAAGGTNTGVIESARYQHDAGNEVWVIGVDIDMYDDGLYTDENGEEQSLILTSAVKNVGEAAYQGIEMALNGTWESGVTTLDYSSGGVGLPDENPNLEDDLVEEAYEALGNHSGVPSTIEEVDSYITTATINGSY